MKIRSFTAGEAATIDSKRIGHKTIRNDGTEIKIEQYMVTIDAYPPTELTEDRPDVDFLLVRADPKHIWMDGEHHVETDDRRAVPGKLYLFRQPQQLLRVVDIIEADDSSAEHGVEDAQDTVVIEYVYELAGTPSEPTFRDTDAGEWSHYDPGHEYGPDGEYTVQNATEGLKRYQLETTQALSMGDRPMVAFKRIDQSTAIYRSTHTDDSQSTLDDH